MESEFSYFHDRHATTKNPDLMKIPSDQFDKTLPVWTKAVGGDPITNALSRVSITISKADLWLRNRYESSTVKVTFTVVS